MVQNIYSALTRAKQEELLLKLLNDEQAIKDFDTSMSDHCYFCGLQNTHCTCIQGSTTSGFTPQSGTTGDATISKMNCISKEENVSFAGKDECYAYGMKSATDPTRSIQDTGDIQLGEFFKRPVKIFEVPWNVGSNLFARFDPWDLFLTNAKVENRITNYNMFRGDLHVKFVINGNSFHFGRILASYLPYSDEDQITQHRSTVPAEMVQESQQPHVFLNPTASTGGEMMLPFFFHKNYASLTNFDRRELGEFTLRSFSTLKHANGATDRVTISCFAWFDNIELTQLTSLDAALLGPQSGEIDQANDNGAISTPATAMAKMAGKLSAIPEIAPFALATQGAATAVATAARAFGYSRPSVTKDPEPFKPLSLSDLAPTSVPDGSRKLTVDDKQELTIDQRISGIDGPDPLVIKEIAKRESFVTQFTWAQTDIPEGFLWNARVDPCMFASNPGPFDELFLTASAAAAVPFKYWTGSMKFRFQFVCSAYHRGRVKIVYDPNYIDGDSRLTYNTNYVHVIDLAEKQDFTVEVGPGQTTTLMEHVKPGVASTGDIYGGLSAFNANGLGNGTLGVYCVNELTTPNSLVNNDIQVNVFVSMGDDFEVFVPDNHFQNLVWDRLAPQSGEKTSSPTEHTVGEEDAPQQTQSDQLGAGEISTKDLNLVYTGEAITSFRQMIKRFNLHSCLTHYNGNGTDRFVIYGRRPAFPALRGYVTGAVDETSLSDNYNYCNTVMLHWVTLMFQGFRGSIRWKIIPRGSLTNARPMMQVQRVTADFPASAYRQGNAIDPDNPTLSQARFLTVQDTTTEPGFPIAGKSFSSSTGAVVFNGYVNPVAEFEIPYYSNTRFIPGKVDDWFSTNPLGPNEAWDYNIFCGPDSNVSYETWCAAGEDYQAYFFTGLPGLFYEPAPPVF